MKFNNILWKVSEFKCPTAILRTYRMAWLFCILSTVHTWLHSFFGNVSRHWREGDVVTAAQLKNRLLLYALKQWRRLKECLLCRSRFGCWSATSVETSVYDVIYMHLECSWTLWPYKECSFIMWEHLKHCVSCRNTWSWTQCYVGGSASC